MKMRINHLTLLVAPILVSYSNFCIASPLSANAAIPRLAPSVGDTPEPTCTPPGTLEKNPDALGTYSSDCVAAANMFFNLPVISRVAWHWKRVAPGEAPQPGYNFLPLAVAPKSCMIRLDVLSDPDAEDQFALVQISNQFRAIFNKCVRPNPHGFTGGFVPVGPRQVLKLSVSPTPTPPPTPPGGVLGRFGEEDKLRLNMTSFLNEKLES